MAKSKRNTSQIDLSQYVTPINAARETGYSSRHVRLLAMRGEIQAVKISPHVWLIHLPSLLEYMKSDRARK